MIEFQMNINTNLIAISGIKGAGKDQVAIMIQYCLSVPKVFRQYWIFKYFGKYFSKSWKITAFATPIKKILSVLLNVSISKFNNRDFKENYCIEMNTLSIHKVSDVPTNKILNDSVFSKKARNFDESLKNYYLTIRQLMQVFATEYCRRLFGSDVWVYSALKNNAQQLIISDLRFVNEAAIIKKHNGLLIYVDRGLEFGQHPSENEMKILYDQGLYNIIIKNDGTLKDLFNKVKLIYND